MTYPEIDLGHNPLQRMENAYKVYDFRHRAPDTIKREIAPISINQSNLSETASFEERDHLFEEFGNCESLDRRGRLWPDVHF